MPPLRATTFMRVALALSGSSVISIFRSVALAFSSSAPCSAFSEPVYLMPMRLSAPSEAVLTVAAGAVKVR